MKVLGIYTVCVIALLFSCDTEKPTSCNPEYFQFGEPIFISTCYTNSVEKVQIQSFKESTNVLLDSFDLSRPDISFDKSLAAFKLILPKKLGVKNTWRIIINDSIKFTISKIRIGVTHENTMLDNNEICTVKSYYFNGRECVNKGVFLDCLNPQ